MEDEAWARKPLLVGAYAATFVGGAWQWPLTFTGVVNDLSGHGFLGWGPLTAAGVFVAFAVPAFLLPVFFGSKRLVGALIFVALTGIGAGAGLFAAFSLGFYNSWVSGVALVVAWIAVVIAAVGIGISRARSSCRFARGLAAASVIVLMSVLLPQGLAVVPLASPFGLGAGLGSMLAFLLTTRLDAALAELLSRRRGGA